MNRRDFFKEISGALSETFKEIVSPFIEQDIEKLDRMAETLSGYQFHQVNCVSVKAPIQEVVVQSEPVIVVHKDNQILALSKRCSECSQVLHYLVYQPVFKCFPCDLEYNLTAYQAFTAFPTKTEQGVLYIGIPKR